MKFGRIRQTDVRSETTLQALRAADDRRVEVLTQIRTQDIGVSWIVHSTAVHRLIEETVNKIPLNFSTG